MKKLSNFYYRLLNKKTRYRIDFLITMTLKEIKERYKRTRIGFLWAFINPLLQMLVMGFVFQFFIPVNIDNYFLFIFIGLLPWNFFSETVLKATNVFVNQRQLIAKAPFPREILLLSIVFSNLFHTLVAFILLFIYFFIFKFDLLYNFNFFILISDLFYLVILTTGVSFFSATLNVNNRDVSFITKFLLSLWFYGTPVVYSLNSIPQSYRFIFCLNPLTGIVEIFRALFIGTEISNFNLYMLIYLLSSIFVFLSYLFFRKKEVFFDDYL